jgi:anaerobic selenocysteine-containing dehydrogenase
MKMARKAIKTVCNLCGLCGCGIEVVVEDGRVMEVRGDKNHAENRGALCPKGRAVIDILYSADRLKHPLKRVGKRGEGKYERISWDQALGLVAENLQKVKDNYGPEAVAFHKGAGHDLCGGDVRSYFYRLANVFGTPNLSSPFYVCNGPRSLNMFLTTGGVPAPDVENSKCILLWGINPTDSALTRQMKIQNARKAAAKLIVIDPRTTYFAQRADIHLQPRPGADGALALGMLKVIIDDRLFDEGFVTNWTVGFQELKTLLAEYPLEKLEKITWVSREKIRKAAQLYAETKPACVFLGNALDQHINTSQTIRAIADLIAITGNLDTKGGNVMLSSMALAKNPVELHERLPGEMNRKRLGDQFLLTRFEYTKIAHEPSVLKAILEGTPYPVKAMFIMAANPMLTSPNIKHVEAALEKLDFLAVADIFMTKTAQLADVVLPACTFLEQTYYATYDAGAYSKPTFPGLLMLRPEVVPPLEESRPDWQIIVDLAKKLGYGEDFPWQNIEEAINYELKLVGITTKDLRHHPEGIQIPGPSFLYQKFGSKGPWGRLLIWFLNRTRFREYPNMYHKYEKIGFMTPSKKVEILSLRLAAMGYDALPVYHEPAESPLADTELARAFPLVLTTGAKTPSYVHSQMRNIPSLNHRMPHNVVEIHPTTAKDLGVGEGDIVAVESPRAEIKCHANLTGGIHPRVVQLYHGFEEANANLLTDSGSSDPVTGSAPLRSSLCRIRIAKP